MPRSASASGGAAKPARGCPSQCHPRCLSASGAGTSARSLSGGKSNRDGYRMAVALIEDNLCSAQLRARSAARFAA